MKWKLLLVMGLILLMSRQVLADKGEQWESSCNGNVCSLIAYSWQPYKYVDGDWRTFAEISETTTDGENFTTVYTIDGTQYNYTVMPYIILKDGRRMTVEDIKGGYNVEYIQNVTEDMVTKFGFGFSGFKSRDKDRFEQNVDFIGLDVLSDAYSNYSNNQYYLAEDIGFNAMELDEMNASLYYNSSTILIDVRHVTWEDFLYLDPMWEFKSLNNTVSGTASRTAGGSPIYYWFAGSTSQEVGHNSPGLPQNPTAVNRSVNEFNLSGIPLPNATQNLSITNVTMFWRSHNEPSSSSINKKIILKRFSKPPSCYLGSEIGSCEVAAATPLDMFNEIGNDTTYRDLTLGITNTDYLLDLTNHTDEVIRVLENYGGLFGIGAYSSVGENSTAFPPIVVSKFRTVNANQNNRPKLNVTYTLDDIPGEEEEAEGNWEIAMVLLYAFIIMSIYYPIMTWRGQFGKDRS